MSNTICTQKLWSIEIKQHKSFLHYLLQSTYFWGYFCHKPVFNFDGALGELGSEKPKMGVQLYD